MFSVLVAISLWNATVDTLKNLNFIKWVKAKLFNFNIKIAFTREILWKQKPTPVVQLHFYDEFLTL